MLSRLPFRSLCAVLILCPCWVRAALTIYVAADGDDHFSGTLKKADRGRTEGPVASVPAALRAARAARRNMRGGEAITILLREGIYELAEPVTLGPEDSGADAKHPFTLAAYPGEHPVISGGSRISGWKRVEGKRDLWRAEVPAVGRGDWYFQSLFINGRRATRARTPNEGRYFHMQGARTQDNPVQFKFKKGDIRKEWAEDPDVELVAFEKWTDFRQHLKAVDERAEMVTLSGSAAPHTREVGAQFFIENAADALDAPGEWHLNRKSGVVTYLARPGEDLSRVEVMAPRLENLMVLQGDFSRKKAVRHVVLRGLTFVYTDWKMTREGYTDRQAAVAVRGDLRADGATDCEVRDCAFTRLAGYAIDFGRGCQRNQIVGNDLYDLGAGGVRIGEPSVRSDPFDQTGENVVSDNRIHHAGLVYPPAVGVFILQSGKNRVAHNDIHDLFYTGVSVGWTWGYRDSPCRENLIEFNHLHDLGHSLLSDMGAVYTLGPQPGTIIRNNLIHDVSSFTYGGWGLYTDEGSTGILMENNVVYRCKSANFHQHYGRENILRNNIFAFGSEHQLMRTREEEHPSFVFTNNIVYYNSGDLLGSNWKNDRFVMEGNLYYDSRPGGLARKPRFSGATFEQWQARGHDVRSIFADPLFVVAKKGDFRLQKKSPAFALGFQAIDLTSVGPRTAEKRGLTDAPQ